MTPALALRLQPPGLRPEPRSYRVAGSDLAADRAVPEFAVFEVPGTGAPPPVEAPKGVEAEPLLFQDRAWVGGAERWTECRLAGAGYELSVAGAGRFLIDGDSIRHLGPADAPALAEALLGPALALALALRGTFCLHASAVAADGRAVVFLGESGAGKSTLATALAGEGFAPVAGDILPVALRGEAPTALPRFPQRPGTGLSPDLPESLPLAALFVLPAPSEPRPRAVELRPLDRRQAALALVRHTVAARLFGPDLLARHLDVCARLAGLPAWRLAYPWEPGALPAVGAALAGALGLTPPATSARS